MDMACFTSPGYADDFIIADISNVVSPSSHPQGKLDVETFTNGQWMRAKLPESVSSKRLLPP